MPQKGGAQAIVRCSEFDHPNSRLSEFIRGHAFNRQLQLLIPGDPPPPSSAAAGGSHVVVQANLAAFLTPAFLEQVINGDGSFWAVAVGSSHAGGQAAITPDRRLVLRLPQEAYRRFGLPGHVSAIEPDVYFVEVDLASKNFRSRGSHYALVLDCLARTERLQLLCAAGGRAGPEAWLPLADAAHVGDHSVRPNSCTEEVAAAGLPALQSLARGGAEGGDANPQLQPERLQAALDALGLLVLGLPVLSDILGEPTQGVLLRRTWTGLLLPEQIERGVAEARAAVAGGGAPWAAAVVRGFPSTPVTWAGGEHAVSPLGGGENDWALLALPGGQYALFVLSGELDRFHKA